MKMKKSYFSRTCIVAGLMAAFLAVPAGADSYFHGYWEQDGWANPLAWVPSGVPGAADMASVHYSINLFTDAHPVSAVSVGTLNLDSYVTWGPPGTIWLRGCTLDILDGGQWQWGDFSDYYDNIATINQYGTFRLVDDISDHYENGPAVVDPISHNIQWGVTFNNHGAMLHEGVGSFMLGANACKYNNYGTHDFVGDGDITTIGHGSERTTNYGLLLKSGGTGESFVNGELVNAGTVEVCSGTLSISHSLDYDGWWSHELKAGKWVVRDGASLVIAARGELTTIEEPAHVILDGSTANLYTTQTYVFTPIEASLTTIHGTLEVHGDRTFAQDVTNYGVLAIGHDTTLTASIVNAGTIQIGNSPGSTVIDGMFTQSPGGTLEIELGGLLAGSEHDLLSVTETATLAGTLSLSYWDGFTASAGEAFTIIVAENLAGQFSSVIFPDNQTWFIDYDLDLGHVRVGVVPEPTTLVLLALGGLTMMRWRRP